MALWSGLKSRRIRTEQTSFVGKAVHLVRRVGTRPLRRLAWDLPLPQLPGDPSLAHAEVKAGVSLIPLRPGQLSVLPSLLHSRCRAEKARRWCSRLYLLLQGVAVLL